MKLGVFGGTFNPIHYGHLRAAEEAREMLSLDKVLFVPSGNPPLKTKDIADAQDRFRMAVHAVANNGFFEVLDVECASPEKSYTINTVETLRARYEDADLYLMLGIDAFLDLPNWWRPEQLVSIINFIVLSRPDRRFADLVLSPYLHIEADTLNTFERGEQIFHSLKLKTFKDAVLTKVTPMAVSSTDIRARIKGGLSIKYLLPEEIESFIIANRLYLPDR